jgi:hypothetical protein
MTDAYVRLLAAVLLTALACVACSKDETPAPDPAVSATPAAVAVSVPPAPASAIAPDPAPASASALASVSAPASALAPASGSARPAPSAKAAPACGDKPLPPCPLYAWMKANTSPAMSAEDFDALAAALDKVVTFAPAGYTAGYTNWVSISKDGASAAHAQSLDGVKAACRGCHDQYKAKYKKEMRDRPI